MLSRINNNNNNNNNKDMNNNNNNNDQNVKSSSNPPPNHHHHHHHHTKKTNTAPKLMKEYQSMDIIHFINHPNLSVYRYIPEKEDGHRRKNRFVCSVCGGEGNKDDLIKVSNHTRKYCHPWCIEPFHFILDNDIQINESTSVDLYKKVKYDDDIKDETNERRDLRKETLSVSFNLNFGPNNDISSFLEDFVQEDDSISGDQKDASSEEPQVPPKPRRPKQKSTRKQRDVSPKPHDLLSDGDKPFTRSQQRMASKQSEKRNLDLKKWCYYKVRNENTLLKNQLLQFINFIESSPSQRNKILKNLMIEDAMPNINDNINESSLLDEILKEYESNNLTERKMLFDSSIFRNMDKHLLKFLAWQRINQLLTQQNIQHRISDFRINENGGDNTKILNPETDQSLINVRENVPIYQNNNNAQINTEPQSRISSKQPVIVVPDSKKQKITVENTNVSTKQPVIVVPDSKKQKITEENTNPVVNNVSPIQPPLPSKIFKFNTHNERLPVSIPTLIPLFNPIINTQHKITNEPPTNINPQQKTTPSHSTSQPIPPSSLPQNISTLSHQPPHIPPPKKLLKPTIQPFPHYHSYQPPISSIPQPQPTLHLHQPPPTIQFQQQIHNYDTENKKRSYTDANKAMDVDESSKKVVTGTNDINIQQLSTHFHQYQPVYESQSSIPINKCLAILKGKGQDDKPFFAFISKEPFHIGRNTENLNLDLSKYTDSKTISHHHASIIYKEEYNCFYLISRGRNGTRINGINFKPHDDDRIIEIPIMNGTTIEMGKVFMVFEILR